MRRPSYAILIPGSSRAGGGTVDTTDLKSVAQKACGFESHPAYHKNSKRALTVFMMYFLALKP